MARLELARASARRRARPPAPAARSRGAWDEGRAAAAAPRRVPGAPGLRRLPQEVREERYREWAAELPAILHDPQVRPAPWRAVRMLVYAADTLRGTALTPGWARGPRSRLSVAGDLLFLVAALVLVAFNAWSAAQAPEDWQKYLLPAWGGFRGLSHSQARPPRRAHDRIALHQLHPDACGLECGAGELAELPFRSVGLHPPPDPPPGLVAPRRHARTGQARSEG